MMKESDRIGKVLDEVGGVYERKAFLFKGSFLQSAYKDRNSPL
jgi:hypothetical protein